MKVVCKTKGTKIIYNHCFLVDKVVYQQWLIWKCWYVCTCILELNNEVNGWQRVGARFLTDGVGSCRQEEKARMIHEVMDWSWRYHYELMVNKYRYDVYIEKDVQICVYSQVSMYTYISLSCHQRGTRSMGALVVTSIPNAETFLTLFPDERNHSSLEKWWILRGGAENTQDKYGTSYNTRK